MNPLEKILCMPDAAHAEFLNSASDADVSTLVESLSEAASDPDIDQTRRSEVIALALQEQSRRFTQ